MIRVEVIEQPTPLLRTVWRFWLTQDFRGISLYLDEMREESRPSTRHRSWRPSKIYLRRHDGRHRDLSTILLKTEPTVPPPIAQSALEQARAAVQLRPWKGP